MNAFQALGLTTDAAPDEVKAAWRQLASVHHPDRGGDAATFVRLREAYREALEAAEAPKPCAVCGGSGRQSRINGWSTIKLPCEACDGTGETR